MILGFVIGIGIAYILTLFGVDHTIIMGVKELIKINIGQSGYYLLLGLVGGISRVMIGGFITGLFVAYIFTFIHLDRIFIEGLKEWFNFTLSSGGYYLLFAVIGAAASFLKIVRTVLKPLSFLTSKKS